MGFIANGLQLPVFVGAIKLINGVVRELRWFASTCIYGYYQTPQQYGADGFRLHLPVFVGTIKH